MTIAGVKVAVTIAPGLQVKYPSRRPTRCTTLDVFKDSAAGALPAILQLYGLNCLRLWCFEERTKDRER